MNDLRMLLEKINWVFMLFRCANMLMNDSADWVRRLQLTSSCWSKAWASMGLAWTAASTTAISRGGRRWVPTAVRRASVRPTVGVRVAATGTKEIAHQTSGCHATEETRTARACLWACTIRWWGVCPTGSTWITSKVLRTESWWRWWCRWIVIIRSWGRMSCSLCVCISQTCVVNQGN